MRVYDRYVFLLSGIGIYLWYEGINNLGAESEITLDTIATTPLQFSTNGNITGISGNEEESE